MLGLFCYISYYTFFSPLARCHRESVCPVLSPLSIRVLNCPGLRVFSPSVTRFASRHIIVRLSIRYPGGLREEAAHFISANSIFLLTDVASRITRRPAPVRKHCSDHQVHARACLNRAEKFLQRFILANSPFSIFFLCCLYMCARKHNDS